MPSNSFNSQMKFNCILICLLKICGEIISRVVGCMKDVKHLHLIQCIYILTVYHLKMKLLVITNINLIFISYSKLHIAGSLIQYFYLCMHLKRGWSACCQPVTNFKSS